jgi:hypothetical protein
MTDIPQHPSSTQKTGMPSTTVRLEPVTENVIVPTPWYKQVFSGPVYRTQTVWKLTFLSLLVIGVIVGQSMVRSPSTIVTQAAVGVAKVSLFPQNTDMTTDKQFQLWFTVDKPVKDATVVVRFNPESIQLSKHVTLSPEKGYSVVVTPAASANQTGTIEVKLIPESGASFISEGTSQLASLFFSSMKGKTGVTQITIDEGATKILNPDNVQFSVTAMNASVTLK